MNENFDAFDEYVMKFDMNEKMIEYKYNHSYRVVHQAEEICRSLDLDTEERDLASLIALLHDIARFKQWSEHKTFDDTISFEHADVGAEMLFDEGLIKNYICKKEDYDIIKKAVAFHNKYSVDFNKLTDREKLQTKIIRDADKIDILYAFSTNRLLELHDDSEEISEKVKEQFMNHEQVVKTDIKNKNDDILLKFSLVFDLYYDYSVERIYNENYINKMYEALKHKKIFKPFVDEANKYLEKRVKDVRK